jgi:hypothetical protein
VTSCQFSQWPKRHNKPQNRFVLPKLSLNDILPDLRGMYRHWGGGAWSGKD